MFNEACIFLKILQSYLIYNFKVYQICVIERLVSFPRGLLNDFPSDYPETYSLTVIIIIFWFRKKSICDQNLKLSGLYFLHHTCDQLLHDFFRCVLPVNIRWNQFLYNLIILSNFSSRGDGKSIRSTKRCKEVS